MSLIDGRAIAARITEQTASSAAALRERGVTPVLAIVVPNDEPGAAWYVGAIQRLAARVGVSCQVYQRPGQPDPGDVLAKLSELSADRAVHGIICQAPLPPGLALPAAGARIAVGKDVDGANPASLGGLAAGVPGVFAPATAAAVIEILRAEQVPLEGRRAVVVGRSTIVGKPAALLLLAGNATVTIAHSRTDDLLQVCREAEILVVAAGQAGLVGADHVAPGAVVIDVGTNATPDGSLIGDVDTGAVEPVARAVSPVPGGVGPVTTAQLMRQTVRAALDASLAAETGLVAGRGQGAGFRAVPGARVVPGARRHSGGGASNGASRLRSRRARVRRSAGSSAASSSRSRPSRSASASSALVRPRSVSVTRTPRLSRGSGLRSTRPASASRSIRLVIVPEVTSVARSRAPGVIWYGGPCRRSADSTSNSHCSSPCPANDAFRARSRCRASRDTRLSTCSGSTSRSGRSARQAATRSSTSSRSGAPSISRPVRVPVPG